MFFSIKSYPERVKKTVVWKHHCRIFPLCANCNHQYPRARNKGFKTHTTSRKKAIERQQNTQSRTYSIKPTGSRLTVFSLGEKQLKLFVAAHIFTIWLVITFVPKNKTQNYYKEGKCFLRIFFFLNVIICQQEP